MHTDSVHFVGKGQIGKVQPGNCTVAPARHRSAYPYSSQQKPRNMACQHSQTHARGEGQIHAISAVNFQPTTSKRLQAPHPAQSGSKTARVQAKTKHKSVMDAIPTPSAFMSTLHVAAERQLSSLEQLCNPIHLPEEVLDRLGSSCTLSSRHAECNERMPRVPMHPGPKLQSLLQLEVRVKGLTTMPRKHKFALDHAPSVHPQHAGKARWHRVHHTNYISVRWCTCILCASCNGLGTITLCASAGGMHVSHLECSALSSCTLHDHAQSDCSNIASDCKSVLAVYLAFALAFVRCCVVSP